MDPHGDPCAKPGMSADHEDERRPEVRVTPEPGPSTGGSGDSAPQQRLARLELVAAGLAQALGPLEVVEIAMAQGLSAVGAQGVTLAVVDGDDLRVVDAKGFPGAAIEKFLRFPVDAELPLSEAARTREPVWISSAEERAQRFPLLVDVDSGVSATASLPLVAGGVLIGALGVGFSADRRLDPDERAFLRALADLIAVAMQRVSVPQAVEWGPPPPLDDLGREARQAEVERLGLLRQTSRPALDRLCANAARILGARMAQISILGSEQIIVAATGFSPPRTGTPLQDSLCSYTLALGRPLNIADAVSHPWVRGLPPVTSGVVVRYLGVPLVTAAGEAVGALCVFDGTSRPWPEGAELVLEQFAASVLTELEYEVAAIALRRAVRRAGGLEMLARRLGETVTVAQVGEVVIGLVPVLLTAGSVAIAGLSPDSRWLQRIIPHRSPAATEVGQRLLASRLPFVRDEEALGALFPDLPASASVFPLEGPLGPVGLLAVADGPEVTDSWTDLHSEARGLIAQALERVRAQEAATRVQAHTAFLAQASLVLDTSLETNETLQRLTRLLVPAIGDICVVRLAGLSRSLTPVAIAHIDASRERFLLEALERLPAHATGLTWAQDTMAAGRGQLREPGARTLRPPPVTASPPGGSKDDDLWPALEHESAICVPLIAAEGSSPLGTLTVMRTERRTRFDDIDDLATLEDLGRRAGRALNNALLHQELLAAARHLREAALPVDLSARPGLELAACYVAAEPLLDVGGDFYDAWSTTAAGDDVWVTIGDVYGGRGEAAAVTGMIRHTLHALAGILPGPGRVLARLNDCLMGADLQSRLCSAALMRLVPGETGHQVTASSAGQVPALVVRSDGEVEVLTVPGKLLGLRTGATYIERTLALNDGDVLVLYTDGVVQAQGDDWMYGHERLVAEARGCAEMRAQDVVDKIRQSVFRYRTSSTDDFAILALRATPERSARKAGMR